MKLAALSVGSFRPMPGVLGAESDLPVTETDVAPIQQALLEHKLLVFRNQRLGTEQLTAFAQRLGEPDRYPFADTVRGSEYVVAVIKEPDDRSNFGGDWHTDTAYVERPPGLTLLYALEVPAVGGDTLFADMTRAYESLSPGMQCALGQLQGYNTAAQVHADDGSHASVAGQSVALKAAVSIPAAEHPLVRVHPGTHRRSLYFSLVHTTHLVGMTVAESRPLLRQLHELVTRPENCTRLQWQPGTLAIWDNRCLQHYALNDYVGQRREMHRIILRGEIPQGVI